MLLRVAVAVPAPILAIKGYCEYFQECQRVNFDGIFVATAVVCPDNTASATGIVVSVVFVMYLRVDVLCIYRCGGCAGFKVGRVYRIRQVFFY